MNFEPERFGKYFLVDKIATGGMAEIFKAKTFGHGGFENLLVIKRILAHLGEDPEFVEMFIDEAKVTVALQHRNIIRIYDFGKLDANYFIAMEYLDGKDTRRILRKLSQGRRYLPIEFAVYIASEACKGLTHAHTMADLQGRPYGIVHRDMSPSNLMVAYSGEVKVADFGIAKAESNLSDTDAGVLKGKYEYMSPEQASGLEIDQRSDIFSLGIVMWEMLTGRRLFKTGNDVLTLEKVKAADVPAPSTVNGRVPKSLDDIVMKALSQDRDERYQTARELYEELSEFLFPSSTDQLAEDVASFMTELFADDIAQERATLEQNNAVASQLHQDMPEPEGGWDSPSARPSDKSTYWLIGLMVVAVVLGVAGVAVGAAYFGGQTVEPVVVTPLGTVLDVMVDPPAQVYVDGLPVTNGPVETATIEHLAPGIYTVRLVAADREPVEERVVLEPGTTTHLWKALDEVDDDPQVEQAVPSPTPRPQGTVPRTEVPTPTPPSPEPEPASDGIGTLTVALVGGGWANVYVDGTKLDRTAPLSGHTLSAGPHEIRVENEANGISHSQTVTVVDGEAVTVRARPL